MSSSRYSVLSSVPHITSHSVYVYIILKILHKLRRVKKQPISLWHTFLNPEYTQTTPWTPEFSDNLYEGMLSLRSRTQWPLSNRTLETETPGPVLQLYLLLS